MFTFCTFPRRDTFYGLGVDEVVLRFKTADTMFFYQDHEGSVTHVRNNAGVMVESYRYDAFGAPTIFNSSAISIPQSAIQNRFMFTGREWNQTFGFYEYRARAYHPVLGRFMSEDPKGFDAGDYNLFRYCGNDPADKVDPSGLAAGFFFPTAGSFASSITNYTFGQGAHGSAPALAQAGGGSDSTAADGLIFAEVSATGSKDIPIPKEWDKKGAEASQNSLREALKDLHRPGEGVHARTQWVIRDSHGKTVLDPHFLKGANITTSRHELTGSGFHSTEIERGAVPLTGIGPGHVHMDVHGSGDSGWSKYDIQRAQGGQPVWKINESQPNVIFRLTPQQNGGAPQPRIVNPALYKPFLG